MGIPLAGLLISCAVTPNATPTPDASDPPPAPAPAAVAPAAVAPAPSVDPTAVSGMGHCTTAEETVFHCTVKGGKALSVCATAGGDLQYRFGPIAAPELVFPTPPQASAFQLGPRIHVRSEGTVLAFVNKGVRYEVQSMAGSGCCSPR